MVQITNFDGKTFSIHTLELKLRLFEVCIESHSLVMLTKFFYGHAGYVDDPLPNTVYIYIIFGCLLALYVHPDRLCDVFGLYFSA